MRTGAPRQGRKQREVDRASSGCTGKGEASWQSKARRRVEGKECAGGCSKAGGGPARTRHGAHRVWYSQAGLRSQMAAAAWGDVSMRLQIDGGR